MIVTSSHAVMIAPSELHKAFQPPSSHRGQESAMDFFYSLLLLTFATLLATLFLSKIWVNKTKSAANREPPELPGNWPVIGHLHLLMGGGKPTHRLLAELAERHGPVFTLCFGMKPTVVASSWELARDCFTTNDRALASRPTSLAMKLMAYDGAMFATAPYGPYWREIRKLATLELLSARRLEMLKHVRALEVDLFVREMFDRWVGNGRNPVKIDMKQQLEDVTFNVTMQMVAGKRYFGRDVPEAEVEIAQRFRVLAKETVRYAGISGFYDSLPFLEWFDFLGHVRNMKRVAKEMDLIVGGWIEEHRRKAESERPRNFIDVLQSTVTEGDLTAVYDSNTVIKATALNIILVGGDTTSNAMQWACALLLKNPRVLKKLQAELDLHVGRNRMVVESDIVNLKYLQSIVKETLRLYPSSTFLIHKAVEDVQVGSFHVKSGTGILVNIWKIQHDPCLWSDPEEFYPERFLTGNQETHAEGYAPFGLGRRSCPGMMQALQVMHLIIARIFHSFELMLPPDAGVDFEEGVNDAFLSPLKVLLIPRLPLQLYQ